MNHEHHARQQPPDTGDLEPDTLHDADFRELRGRSRRLIADLSRLSNQLADLQDAITDRPDIRAPAETERPGQRLEPTDLELRQTMARPSDDLEAQP
ncbi:hypothetical protein KUA19_41945 [Catellatospora sp. NEAU-YM18]|nr:hypothetical protein [Catellatospora tritici]